MKAYPKRVKTNADLLNDLTRKGMTIEDLPKAETALNQIGYYRFRGYAFHLLDKANDKFADGVTFESVLQISRFDAQLASLLFSMTSKIEIALRARLCNALLSTGEPLIFLDASVFKDKKSYWQNLSTLSSEIARSSDVFIAHNYDQHDGQIPIWAAVEVMSFGTLSKFIKNLTPGPDSIIAKLANNYTFVTQKGNRAVPNLGMFSSWIHSIVVLRNTCAHNSRIYNRAISTKPELLNGDRQIPPPRFFGLYQIILAMKYLRPSDEEWNSFVVALSDLLTSYTGSIDISRMQFPSDWLDHIKL